VTRAIRFGPFYDSRNPTEGRQDPTGLYRAILAQIERGEEIGGDDVWLSEHHCCDDDYTPPVLPLTAPIAARTTRIRIDLALLLLPTRVGCVSFRDLSTAPAEPTVEDQAPRH
jgi:alkanesulfonate monooxygenase SsuD/methylene tetrahydromethanopterin reductase-like flavin-dependent oxidoreductase (luciferase family)